MNLNFDVDNYIRFVLPSFLRKPIIKGFLKVLLTSVIDLWVSTSNFYTAVINELQTTILTNVLQTRLRNSYPDVGAFKVFIKTQWDNIPQLYIQKLGEHRKQEYCYNLVEAVTPQQYIWLNSERDLLHDYYVIVPTTYTSNQSAIEFVLNKFKPAGKRYLLIFDDITS